MERGKAVAWGWCVLLALVSLAWPTSGQGCNENLSGKVTATFNTTSLRCQLYTVGGAQFFVWASKDGATQVTSMVVAVPLRAGNWAGIGFSSEGKMPGSNALIATLSSTGTGTGTTVATVYDLKGRSPGSVTPSTSLSFVGGNPGTYYHNTSQYAYMSYQVNLANSTPANPTFLLAAYGPLSGASLQQHSSREVFDANFITGVNAGESAESKLDKRVKVHGSLNMLGWGLLLPLGTMVARYARCFDPAWFYIHIAFQIVGFGCIVAGLVTGFDVAKELKPEELDAHRGLGIFLMVLASLQVLAVVLRPKKDAKVRVYWNYYHHWVGRLALFLAVVNIFVGLYMSEAERDFKVGYISILAIEVGLFVVLEILLWLRWNRQRPHHDAPEEDPNFQFGGNV